MAPKKAPFTYSALDTEMKRQLLEQRLSQIEQEHFNHATNREVILGQPVVEGQEPARDAALAATDRALAELEAAHNTIAAQIAAL